nr:hypothetical protein [Pontibacter sp. SGAir0037]
MEKSEHHPNLVSTADTTGHSAFHDDSCPVFCGCGCCATYTIKVEPERFIFRALVKPQTRPVTYPEMRVSHYTFSLWHPPRPLA